MSPFVGGAFGSAASLAACHARRARRARSAAPSEADAVAPRNVLRHRPPPSHQPAGRTRRVGDGRLQAIVHDAWQETRPMRISESLLNATRFLHSCPKSTRGIASRGSASTRRPTCARRVNRASSSRWSVRWTSWRSPCSSTPSSLPPERASSTSSRSCPSRAARRARRIGLLPIALDGADATQRRARCATGGG